ncbi:MAG TPA: phage major capsid protein [Propionibacteriaceae bacterium]|jgi:HK97 family phage major capsid protein
MDDMLKRLMDRLTDANKRRDGLVEARKAIVDVAKQEKRDGDSLTEDEDKEFRDFTGQIRSVDEEIRSLDERITELSDEEKRSQAAVAAARRAASVNAQLRVTEARTYERGNRNSYLKDLATAQIMGDQEARERLNRHAEEVRQEPEYKEYRDLNRADGSGGAFVPPAWLMGQYIELARAGRPTANLFNTQPLPPGTDSINIPRVLTGTAVAVQPADNDPVQEVDLTDSSLNIPVRTIAGQQDVAIQLLDQSPVNFDEIVFRDLLADYALKTNVQILAGTGASGQVLGLGAQTGVTAITVTPTTVAGLYSAIANAVQSIYAARFAAPTVIVMHPRRWAWLISQLDGNSRPLVVPAAQGPNNAIGTFAGLGVQQVVGNIQGLPVVTDPSIPTNQGAGTNQDVVYILKADDVVLYESGIRTRVLQETLSGTLTVRLQVYGYLAFSAGRYAASTARLTGVGLVAPTF